MKIRILHVLLPLIVLGCTKPAQAPTTTAGPSGDDAINKSLRTYVVEFLRRNPTTNTYLGGAGLDPSLKEVDGTLRDFSSVALQQEDQWLTDTAKAIEAVAPGTLSPRARIDRDVALAQIGFMLRQHTVRKYQHRALDTYVGEPFRALDWQLQGMSQTGATSYGTADEWQLVVNRVAGIPRFLTVAQEQLVAGVNADRVPDPRMLLRDGINTCEANAKYFGETLPALAAERLAGPQREVLLTRLRDAGRAASDAYRQMRNFVAQTFFDGAGAGNLKAPFAADRFAMGEEAYNWALKNNFRIDKTAAQLYDEAWPIVEHTRQQMIDLAREIGKAKGWRVPADGPSAVRSVFDELSKDYPKSDAEMIAWYRDSAFRLVD
jgi:uncharacterized protein (DUF885 family)